VIGDLVIGDSGDQGMQLARVIGDVVATRRRQPTASLLILQPLTPERENARPDAGCGRSDGAGSARAFVRGGASFPFHPVERQSTRASSGFRSATSRSKEEMQIASESSGRSCRRRSMPSSRALLLVQPLNMDDTPRGRRCRRRRCRRGVRETVLVVLEGARRARHRRKGAPVDAAIVGIIDRVDFG
jgi:microcompartment protein CcmK/EutM